MLNVSITLLALVLLGFTLNEPTVARYVTLYALATHSACTLTWELIRTPSVRYWLRTQSIDATLFLLQSLQLIDCMRSHNACFSCPSP